tara:strand:- start:123 stop:266 length:144 start_codon:yes stop_codon:yes gene_type:complete
MYGISTSESKLFRVLSLVIYLDTSLVRLADTINAQCGAATVISFKAN